MQLLYAFLVFFFFFLRVMGSGSLYPSAPTAPGTGTHGNYDDAGAQQTAIHSDLDIFIPLARLYTIVTASLFLAE